MTDTEKQALKFKDESEIQKMYKALEPHIKRNLINSKLPIREQTLNVFKYEDVKKYIHNYEKHNITR